jgi:hypothetical protein
MTAGPSHPLPRRVLIVAYYFPPIGGIGSIRARGFAIHLPESGWEPTILAPSRTPHAPDPSLSFPEHKVVRCTSLEVRRPAHSGGSGGDERQEGKHDRARRIAGATRRLVNRYATYPDPQIGWYPAATRTGLRLARDQPFDAVFSSSFPITAHVIARTISRRHGIPWVAEFRDPWSDRLPALPHRKRAARLEKRIATDARRVVMPSPAWADEFGRRWGVDIDVIPNGSDATPAAGAHPTKPVLAHVGSYYPGRQSLRAVWRALAGWRTAGGDLPEIRWVGEMPPEARAELAACGLEAAVDVTGFVSHAEAARLLSSSSMLFASGPVGSGAIDRGWLPAKLFEYVASGLPVLYVGHSDGDAARLLAEYRGCSVVAFDDVAAAGRALREGLSSGTIDRDSTTISRVARATALARVLDAAAIGPQPG